MAKKHSAGRKGEEGESLSFEDAMEQVDMILRRIESGDIGLEQSVDEYERGMKLLEQCRRVLDKAEERIEEINRRSQDQEPASGSGSMSGSGEDDE